MNIIGYNIGHRYIMYNKSIYTVIYMCIYIYIYILGNFRDQMKRWLHNIEVSRKKEKVFASHVFIDKCGVNTPSSTTLDFA